MLDDLARCLGYERALVLTYVASSSSLRGLFGLAIRDEQARALAVPLARPGDPVDDPVLVADAQNDILHFNRRAEHLFRATDEDSAGKRRAVSMNNFLFTAALSGWSLERGTRGANREVTLVDPIDGSELIFEVI